MAVRSIKYQKKEQISSTFRTFFNSPLALLLTAGKALPARKQTHKHTNVHTYTHKKAAKLPSALDRVLETLFWLGTGWSGYNDLSDTRRGGGGVQGIKTPPPRRRRCLCSYFSFFAFAVGINLSSIAAIRMIGSSRPQSPLAATVSTLSQQFPKVKAKTKSPPEWRWAERAEDEPKQIKADRQTD